MNDESYEGSHLYAMRHSAAHVMAEAVLKLFPEGKLDLIDEFAQRGEELSIYHHGDFTDLCRGPHVHDTSELGVFKLMSVAGAYWRGDEHNPMLQRIYGTLFPTQDELDAYLQQLEEARRRDHRRLGKELGLFVFSEDVGPGIPLFLPKGETLRHIMEEFVRETQTRHGYKHVWTGHVVKEDLYRRSGHLQHYSEVMFPPMDDGEDRYRLKPMNCPSHMTLYKAELHSYRDLPLRYAEFATLYRYEKSGELNGLTRVRSVTQDDCHVFCTPDQVQEEFGRALDLITEVLDAYGFHDYRVELSLPDLSDTTKYIAEPEKWALAERALRDAMDASGMQYTPVVGEAAFYGPKADFMARDVLGRQWQLSTIQVDMIQPARLGLEYLGEDGARHTPVMLHRAVTGSTERFMGVIIEHFAGAFPVWLSPLQAVVIPVADRHLAYARKVQENLSAKNLRVEVDDSQNSMQKKIRDAQLQKVPYMLVVGNNEAASESAALRLRTGEDLGALPLHEVRARLLERVKTKSLDL